MKLEPCHRASCMQIIEALQDKCNALKAERDHFHESRNSYSKALAIAQVQAIDDEALMREVLDCGATEYERMADLRVKLRARLEQAK